MSAVIVCPAVRVNVVDGTDIFANFISSIYDVKCVSQTSFRIGIQSGFSWTWAHLQSTLTRLSRAILSSRYFPFVFVFILA